MKKLVYNIMTIIAICILLISLFSVKNQSLFGCRIYRVASGSMEPYIKVGDFIIIKKQNEYDTGDIITYIDNEECFITHRIILINGNEIITKGDANNTRDASINKQQVIGKVILKIHIINFISYLLTKPVTWILILVIGIFSIIVFSKQKENIQIRIKKRRQKRREKKRKGVKMRKQKRALRKKITNFLIIYFLIFTLNFTANTFSKYVGRIDGNGSTQVAKWDVEVDNEISAKSINLVSGNTTQEYTFEVTSNSEIAAKYDIILTNVPNDIKVTLDGKFEKTPTNNIVEFPNAGAFEVNNLTNKNTHVLKFETTINTEVQNNTNIDLKVVFEQEEL